MDLNTTTVQLAVLALPGLVWAMLDAANRHSSQSAQFAFIVRVFVFGIFTYAILAAIYRILGRSFDILKLEGGGSVFSSMSDEILWSVPLAFALGSLWVAGRTHAWLHKALQKLRISDYAGYEDIWDFTLSSASPVGRWVHIRDFSERVVYTGFVTAYSDRPDLREVILTDSSVYDFDGNEMYGLRGMYIARLPECVTLEFPHKEDEDDKADELS